MLISQSDVMNVFRLVVITPYQYKTILKRAQQIGGLITHDHWGAQGGVEIKRARGHTVFIGAFFKICERVGKLVRIECDRVYIHPILYFKHGFQ